MTKRRRWSGWVLGCVLGAVVAVAASAAEEAGPAPKLEDAALIVIDIQAFYFPGGMVPLVEPEAAAANARTVIEAFRAAGRPVIHIQHLPKGVETPDPTGIAEQYRIHPSVLPAAGEPVIGKHHANAFRNTALLKTLRGLGVQRVVIVGMQTHMCVEAAARAAADLGFVVTVVSDACATRNLEFGGDTVPASQVHASTLASLAGSYGRVVTTAELCEVAQ